MAVRGENDVAAKGSRRTLVIALALTAGAMSACGGGGDALPQAGAPAPAPASTPRPNTTPDAVNGKALYLQNCSGCHGLSPDERVLQAAGDGGVILQAVGGVRIMNVLSPTIGPAEAQDIALWLEAPS